MCRCSEEKKLLSSKKRRKSIAAAPPFFAAWPSFSLYRDINAQKLLVNQKFIGMTVYRILLGKLFWFSVLASGCVHLGRVSIRVV